jgi:hypothetical protein
VGLDTPSPAELGLRLVKGLPKTLTDLFEVLVLADTAFGSNEFVARVRQLKHHALVGVRCDRRLEDGRTVLQLHKRGIQVRLFELKFPVHMSWYYFKREDGKARKTLCLMHQSPKGKHYHLVGQAQVAFSRGSSRRRLHRFGLHRFGQGTLLGVYRWLLLSLTAYLLAHWAYLHLKGGVLPDWGEAAQIALDLLLPSQALLPLLAETQRLQPLAKIYGLDIQVVRC